MSNITGRGSRSSGTFGWRGRKLTLLAIVALAALGVTVAFWELRESAAARETRGPAAAAPDDPNRASCPSSGAIHVSPDGQPGNDGSPDSPLDLATALSAESPARPCDTIWLRGGTYRAAFKAAVSGAEGRPVVVREYPGEQATIDSAPSPEPALQVTGSWVWYWGFGVTNSDPQRTSKEQGQWPGDLRRGTGIASSGSHVKFINLRVHDMARGFEVNEGSVDTEFYGSVIYSNGWEGPNSVAQGNGIDTRNQLGSRRIVDNIIFNQFSHGIAIFGNHLDNITLEGNVVFGNGSVSRQGVTESRNILLGGAVVARNPVVRANITYNGQTNLGYTAGCSNATVTENYFAGPLVWVKCAGTIRGNTVYDPSATGYAPLSVQYPDNTYHTSRPNGVVVRMRPNKFEPGRANLVVLNWDTASNVAVDLAAAGLTPGQRYEIRDVWDFRGKPVVSGTYYGGTVTVPLAKGAVGRPATAIPVTPAHTLPEFGVFVILKVEPSPGS